MMPELQLYAFACCIGISRRRSHFGTLSLTVTFLQQLRKKLIVTPFWALLFLRASFWSVTKLQNAL